MNLSIEEQKQKEYYNRISGEYDVHYASEGALRYKYRLFDKFLGQMDFAGTTVLDGMCGGGQNSGYFEGKGCEVYGIDISENQCAQYARRFPANKVVCGSARNTPFEDNYFDFIITDSVHHLHPYIDETFAEFNRILKPGGMLLMWEPSARSVLDYARKLWYRMDTKYFEANEKSIDPQMGLKGRLFRLRRKFYGGNVGYLFVFLTMALRIRSRYFVLLNTSLIQLDYWLSHLQFRLTSLWVLLLYQKNA